MDSSVKQIIGKRIKGIVAKKHDYQPHSQLFLIFSDETYYEFYTYMSEICATGGVCVGGLEKVREYMGEEDVVFVAIDHSINE